MAQAHHALKVLPVLLIAAMLGGCPASARRPEPSSTPPSPATPAPSSSPANVAPPPASTQPGAPPPAPQRQNTLSPATRSLATQARSLLAHGDVDGASATLDRALRIEPNNPLLWIELGRVRLAEGDPRQAEGCGRKALALASGDHAAQQQAGHLLADALRGQRRNQEARDVESQPFMN